MSCGSCLQGCPTNAGKSTLNTYIHDAWAAGRLELRAEAPRRAGRDRGRRGDGASSTSTATGALHRVDAGVVVVAAGTLNTPQLLLRSGLPESPSSRLVGRNLGFHPVRLVYGLFDEPQDAHMVYPITAHAMEHQHDEDGGFVIEATTIQDPIGFATTLEDENGPLWGDALVEAVRSFRRWIGAARDGERRQQRQSSRWTRTASSRSRRRSPRSSSSASTPRSTSRATCSWPRARRSVMLDGARSARTCRARAAWAATRSGRSSTPTARSWDVERLYVGDGSVVPRTLSVNPSLTIMALASRLAEHLDADPHGYLS